MSAVIAPVIAQVGAPAHLQHHEGPQMHVLFFLYQAFFGGGNKYKVIQFIEVPFIE